jgi:hypothetical protein
MTGRQMRQGSSSLDGWAAVSGAATLAAVFVVYGLVASPPGRFALGRRPWVLGRAPRALPRSPCDCRGDVPELGKAPEPRSGAGASGESQDLPLSPIWMDTIPAKLRDLLSRPRRVVGMADRGSNASSVRLLEDGSTRRISQDLHERTVAFDVCADSQARAYRTHRIGSSCSSGPRCYPSSIVEGIRIPVEPEPVAVVHGACRGHRVGRCVEGGRRRQSHPAAPSFC